MTPREQLARAIEAARPLLATFPHHADFSITFRTPYFTPKMGLRFCSCKNDRPICGAEAETLVMSGARLERNTDGFDYWQDVEIYFRLHSALHFPWSLAYESADFGELLDLEREPTRIVSWPAGISWSKKTHPTLITRADSSVTSPDPDPPKPETWRDRPPLL